MRSWRFFNMILLLVVLQVMASVNGLTSKTNQDCIRNPIGLQYRNSVPDGRFEASSYCYEGTSDTRYKPSSARLHGNNGWAPRTNTNPKDYLQIDLGKERIVCGVATQGNSLHYEWVTQYKLLFSMDGVVWNTYQENKEDKTFQGNEDHTTVVRRYLQSFKPVRYIRFMPMKYRTFKTVRLEIYASDLDGPHVFPYQRSLELTWRIMEKQVASYQIEFENKSTIVSFDLPHSTVEYNLTNLQPYTEYSVRMKAITNNGLGSWTNWVNMKTRIAEPNAMPFNVSLTPTSSKDMDVAWKLRGIECLNGPLAGYRITWTSERGTTKTMDVGNTTTYKLTSLEARTLYNIIVSVRNTKYIGPPSEVVQATTFGDASSCSPRITSATAVSSTSIHVIWEPPLKGECRNGVLKGYYISWYIQDRGVRKHTRIDNPNVSKWNLTGLEKYSEYIINLRAYTTIYGPPYQVTAKTAEDGPSCSPNITYLILVSSTSIRVNWSPLPNKPCLNGILRGYRIAYRRLNETMLRFVNISNPNITTKLLSGLRKYTEYHIHVLGYTVKDGIHSKASVARTLEDVPECSPVFTDIRAASSTSIRVAWQQTSTCLNGILRGYIIMYSLYGNSTTQSINMTDYRLIISKTVTGFRKYTKYSFRILAYTIGEGPISSASVIRTAEAAPTCSPNLLSVDTTSSTSVRLTWTPPSDNECRNGVLRGYLIGCRLLEDKKTETFPVYNANATTHQVGGLRPYTLYTFFILAVTVYGGPWSNSLDNMTGEDAPVCSPTLASARNVSSTCIHVSWSPPPSGSCRNGILRGYRLFYSNTKTGKTLVMNISDSVTTTVDVTGLSKYTEYSFRILGYTVKDSQMSDELRQTTSEDAPDCSPKLKSVQALSSTSIRVTWYTLPTSPCTNGIVRGYKIKYKRHGGKILTFKISNGGATTTDIKGLNKFTFYKFQVLAYTIKDGSLSNSLPASTTADAPSTPVNVNRTLFPANGSVGPRVQIGWDEPREKNGVIQKYTLVYMYHKDKSTKRTIVIQEHGQPTHVYSIAVLGETTFSFRINAYTIEDGPYQKGEDLIIPAYPPSIAPTNISSIGTNGTSFLLQWSPIPLELRNGNVAKYEVRWTVLSIGRTFRARRDANQKTKKAYTKKTEYTITGLLSCSQYGISVRAYTIAGPGPFSTSIKIHTSKPESPFGVSATQTNATGVLLEWKKPANVIEIINEYMIEYKGYKTYYNYKMKGNKSIQNGRTRLWINKLVPATYYELWVSAITACGKSPRSNSTSTKTPITNPLGPKITTIQQYHGSATTVNVTLFPSVQINGPISAYQVIVQFLRKRDSFDQLPLNYEQNLFDYLLASKNNLDYYVAAEVTADWLRLPKELMIGNNMTYYEFRNVPLRKGSRYHIYQRAVTNDRGRLLYSKEVLVANVSVTMEAVEETKAHLQDSSGSESLIGGIVGLLLLLILVIIIGYFVWRWHTKIRKRGIKQSISLPLVASPPVEQEKSSSDKVQLQAPVKEEVTKPIHVTKFPEYIATMKEEDFSQLINQYKMIPSTHIFSCITSKKPVNKVKNRYGNIVPYDHSRVPLTRINEDEDSDYINASFMHGYDGSQKTYIAAQGPKPETINDFWRMIWEQNTSTIVMLTNLVELGKRKCHQYWPEDSEQYEDITIQNHKTEVFADYLIRTLLLSKGTTEKISRRVHLFHFIAWPDKGVPQNATALLSFRKKVRELSEWKTGPSVIHCSAGVGRTGTYMIIDAMLEQVESKETIDIYNYLKVLRKNRPYMVQTSEQYVFIHIVLFEEITCGNTEIQANNMNTTMKNLAAKDNEQNLSGYAIEFKRLEFVALHGIPDKCDVGEEEENVKKNRHKDIVAGNRCRVILSTDDSNQGDYINATFIDNHRERNAFILTQAPMENTIADFWRMVMDYEIGTIVMLNNLQEEYEPFPDYWPQEGTIEYNGIEVELLETEKYDDIILRTIRVSYQSVNHYLQHLQYTAWENNSVPNNFQSFLDLFEKLWKSQQKCNNNPVVIQCSNGVGRSGTFCAIASCLERVKQEQVLDVFQTVKSIRVNRPGAVETLLQYEYCYSALKEYLNSFSDYANFTGE